MESGRPTVAKIEPELQLAVAHRDGSEAAASGLAVHDDAVDDRRRCLDLHRHAEVTAGRARKLDSQERTACESGVLDRLVLFAAANKITFTNNFYFCFGN